MRSLTKVAESPTPCDSKRNYLGTDLAKVADWLVVLGRNRDSGCLTNSNWEVALERLGGESDNVQIFNFGHWACGWIEYLCVKEGTEAEKMGYVIEAKLDNYPILDEMVFGEMEQAEASYIWNDCYNVKERINYIREHRNQFEFHDFADLLGCVRGKYFAGYANELLA